MKKHWKNLLFCKLVVVFLFTSTNVFAGKPAEPKLPKNYLKIPIVPQATSYSCGAAALTSILYYFKSLDAGESYVYEYAGTHPDYGTQPTGIADAARDFGLKAEIKEGMTIEDLRESLKRKNEVVILSIQAWRDPAFKKLPWKDTWDDGHYVVLVGMDDTYVYVMDPSSFWSYGYIPIYELLDRWHDYEDRDGYIWRYFNLGVILKGKETLEDYPAKIIKIE